MADILTAEQQAAVENRGRSLLVSAAAGSGQTVEDVNKLLRQFEAMQKMMKKVKRNPKGFMRGLGGMRGLR